MAQDFSTVGTQAAGDSLSFYFWMFIGVAALAALLMFIYQWLRVESYHKGRIPRSLNMLVLKILVPKGEGDKVEQKDQLKELMQRASQLYASLYSLKDASMHRKDWYPHGAHLSLEIVSHANEIYFYIAVPRELQSLAEKQIFSFYPDATIEQSERPNIFSEGTHEAAAELILEQPTTFPIRTYKEFENDPLNTITSTLARLAPNEGAAIQILLRPAKNGWHRQAESHIKQLQEGKKVKKNTSGLQTVGKITLDLIGDIAKGAAAPEEKKEGDKPKTLSPMTEQVIKIVGEKAQFVGYESVIRIVVASPEIASAKVHLANITSAFTAFNNPTTNGFRSSKSGNTQKIIDDYIFRAFPYRSDIILNTEELASLWHIPHRDIDTPSVVWLKSKRAPAPTGVPTEGTYLGTNIFRGQRTPIHMLEEDRKRHMYVIGKTGTGKSIFLEDMCLSDIRAGHGVCFIDPHGESIDRILQQIPKERIQDVILFDPSDLERPMGLNLLEYERPEERTIVVGELLNIFDKLFDLSKTGGPIFEQYFRNAALLVMEDPDSGSTLLEIPKVMSDEAFRHMKLERCQNILVKNFWLKEAEATSGEQSLANFVPYINSKMTSFLANDFMLPIVSQQKSAFNIRDVMDNQKILLMKLSKGQISESNANLLGLVMVSKIYLATMSRADIPEEQRKTFYLYIDEFQNFATKSVSDILAEARKYGLGMITANQFIGQLTKGGDTMIRDAVFGNAGTAVSFRVGAEDAEQLVKQYYDPIFNVQDLTNIEKANCYIKLLVNGTNLRPFSMNLYKDMSKVERDPRMAQMIRELSRLRYGRDRDLVMQEIQERSQ